MKIVGGSLKGHRLVAPEGLMTRPTSEAQREAIFNVLFNGMGLEPLHVLDIFSGSGALGLEALSWGSEKAVFIDSSVQAIKAIKRNIENCKLSKVACELIHSGKSEIWITELKKWCNKHGSFDLIFCDPPYGKGLVGRSLNALEPHAMALWAEGAMLVAELGKDDEAPKLSAQWKLVKERAKGSTQILFYRRLQC